MARSLGRALNRALIQSTVTGFWLMVLALCLHSCKAEAGCANQLTILDAAQTTRTFCRGTDGGSNWVFQNQFVDSAGALFGTAGNPFGVNVQNSPSVAQSGVWTVQPGNTANTTAWLVTGTGGAFPATQSGNWSVRTQDALGNNITSTSNALDINIKNSNATVTVTGSGTFTTSDTHFPATQALTDSISNPTVTGVAAFGMAWDATNTIWRRAQIDPASKGLLVDIVAGGAGTSSAFGAAFPANGTAIGFKNGSGNMDFAKVDSNNFVDISCGGNPCNLTDNSAFSAGTTGYSNVGGLYQSTVTNNACTSGNGCVAQVSKYRAFLVDPYDSTGTEMANTTNHAIQIIGTAGTAILGKIGIDQTTDITTNGVEIAPTAASAAGIAPVVSSAVESNHVLKASAGNLYGAMVQTGAVAGCLMIFNATSAPVDGAVTPAVAPIEVAANSTVGVLFGSPPAYFSTGITLVYSSTCGLTKTASATALFSGQIK